MNGFADDSEAVKIDSLRIKFETTYQDQLRSGVYSPVDVERVRCVDDYVTCFLNHQHDDIDKAAAMIDASLRWRKELDLNGLSDASFPRQLHESGAIFYHNRDKEGHQILHIHVSKHKKSSETNLIIRKYMAWQIDRVLSKKPGERIAVIFDMSDASLSNVDVDLVKFQIACFTTYFPSSLAYILLFEMPWVLNAIWNLIKKLLTAEQQKFVIMVKKHHMTKYIDPDQLFVHMGGTDDYKYVYMPSDDSGVELIQNGGESDAEKSLVSSGEYTVTDSGLRRRVQFGDIPRTQSCASNYSGSCTDDISPCPSDSAPSHHIAPQLSASLTSSNQKASELSSSPVTANQKTVDSGTTTNKTNGSDNGAHIGTLASVRPGDKLTFRVSSDGTHDTAAHMSLTNVTNATIAFKVKTTSPDVYRVRPHTGLIERTESADISVTLLAGHQAVVKDKFLVMIILLSSDQDTSPAGLNNLWKTVNKESSNYMEHRLTCDTVTVSPDVSQPGSTQHTQPVNRSACNRNVMPADNALNTMSVSDKMDQLLKRQHQLEEQMKLILKLQMFIVGAVLIIILYAIR